MSRETVLFLKLCKNPYKHIKSEISRKCKRNEEKKTCQTEARVRGGVAPQFPVKPLDKAVKTRLPPAPPSGRPSGDHSPRLGKFEFLMKRKQKEEKENTEKGGH